MLPMRRGAAALLAGAALSGCVERIIAVRTEPPGAAVYVDDEKVGVTPCEVRYSWYGTRSLAIELEGYRGVRELVNLRPPWWQIFPLDFVTDVLIPFTITDRVELSYALEPARASPREAEEVKRRAAELREKAGIPKDP